MTELAKRIEAGVLACEVLTTGRQPAGNRPASRHELEALVSDGATARDQLVVANLPLVGRWARPRLRENIEIEDLMQAGALGLMHAIKMFDHTRGIRFSTYASSWIRQAIGQEVLAQLRLIRYPQYVEEKLQTLRREGEALQNDLGRSPTRQEMSDHLDLAPEELVELLTLPSTLLSLDARWPVHWTAGERWFDDECVDDETPPGMFAPLHELIDESPHAFTPARDAAGPPEVRAALKALPPRQAEVMRLRYGFDGQGPLTLQAIGEKLGLTKERIRQIHNAAATTLRQLLEQRPESTPGRDPSTADRYSQHSGEHSGEAVTPQAGDRS